MVYLHVFIWFYSSFSSSEFESPVSAAIYNDRYVQYVFFYLFTNRYICFTYDLEQSGRIGFLYGNFHYVKVAIKKRVNMYCIAYDLVQICIGTRD